MERMNVVLAGAYPDHTFERLNDLLPNDLCRLIRVETQAEYDAMTEAQIMILRNFKAKRDMMERNPKLKIILRWGAGFDSVDIKESNNRGIIVTNTPGANAAAVSELTLMLMLSLGRKLLCHCESLRRGEWSKNTYLNSSYCLNHKLVGIVGGGNIGRQVADKARAFGAKTQYFDVYRLETETEQAHEMTYVSFETLLQTSDVITLHVPLTDSTRHLIGAEEIGKMKDKAILINTARGGLVDDRALAEAVRRGRLGGAGLDVVEREPLPAGDELLGDPNIIVTPHVGGGTADIGDEIIPMLVSDIRAFLEGREPQYIVNKR